MSPEEIAVLAGVSILIGLSKGGYGPVLGGIATPLLSLVMPVSEAVAMALPLLLLGDLFALRVYWRQWDFPQIRLLVPAAALGVLGGTLLLDALPDRTLRSMLGGVTLLLAIYNLLGERLTARSYTPRDWHGYTAGAASGFGSAVANAGGPPFTAYLLLQHFSPVVFMGTTTLFFIVVNLIKLPSFWLAGLMDDLALSVVFLMVPLVLLGIELGRHFVQGVDPKTYEKWMLALLLMTGVVLFLLILPGEDAVATVVRRQAGLTLNLNETNSRHREIKTGEPNGSPALRLNGTGNC